MTRIARALGLGVAMIGLTSFGLPAAAGSSLPPCQAPPAQQAVQVPAGEIAISGAFIGQNFTLPPALQGPVVPIPGVPGLTPQPSGDNQSGSFDVVWDQPVQLNFGTDPRSGLGLGAQVDLVSAGTRAQFRGSMVVGLQGFVGHVSYGPAMTACAFANGNQALLAYENWTLTGTQTPTAIGGSPVGGQYASALGIDLSPGN